MGTTLENGIYLPDEGERNCYDGLAGNWVALDNHLGSTNIHVTINDKQAWNGHIADTTIHVTSADKQAWNGHIADTTIHVTSADKQTWNGKADNSALTAHTGDTTIHVTAEDKAKWDAVTSKADDSDVVHKSGNETINGNKTFSSINGVKPSSLSLPSYSTSRIDISSYITDLTGGSNNYTAPSNGYIFVRTTNGTDLKLIEYPSGVMSSVCSQTANNIGTFIPVLAGRICIIQIKCSSIDRAYFIPCQGNV